MKQRILTACWLIPLAILWMFFVPETAFAAGAVVLVLLGAYEWGKFVFRKKHCSVCCDNSCLSWLEFLVL